MVNIMSDKQINEFKKMKDIDFYFKIGQRIKIKRNEKGINQEELAGRIGLTRTSITNMEQGKQSVSTYMLWKISKALNIEMVELLPIEVKDILDVTNRKIVEDVTNGLINHTRAIQSINDIQNKFIEELSESMQNIIVKKLSDVVSKYGG